MPAVAPPGELHRVVRDFGRKARVCLTRYSEGAMLAAMERGRDPLKVKFLHIPKTAGSSIRSFLSRFFLPWHVCPALNDQQLLTLSPERLRSYRMFAGHFSWTLLDRVEGDCFTFSVLREPVERLVSYYFFMRAAATARDAHLKALPENRMNQAALTLSPDEFFCGGPSEVRNDLDEHFDNFYTYYFAERSWGARRRMEAGKTISEAQLLESATRNLNLLDRLYSTGDLASLQDDIVAACGQGYIGRWATFRSRVAPLKTMKLNYGTGHFSSRLADLKSLGATQRTFDRIEEMTRLDRAIWISRFG